MHLRISAYERGVDPKIFLNGALYAVFKQDIDDLADVDIQRSRERKSCGKFQAKIWYLVLGRAK